jgi:hypothetical protein
MAVLAREGQYITREPCITQPKRNALLHLKFGGHKERKQREKGKEPELRRY